MPLLMALAAEAYLAGQSRHLTSAWNKLNSLIMMPIIIILEHPAHHPLYFLTLRSLSCHSIHNHSSTHLPLLLLLPISSWLMAVLLLPMFSYTVGKSKCSCVLLKVFLRLDKNPETFGVRNCIFRYTGAELFNTATRGKFGTNGIPRYILILPELHS